MSSVSCSICWEVVTSTCVVSYLLCGHVYHQTCVEKWLKTARTCPECRNGVSNINRIYLNLVPDPQIDHLNLELAKKNKEFQFSKTDNEIQDAIIKQLEREMRTKLLEKDEEIQLITRKNDELKATAGFIEHQNAKLNLELEMQEKQRAVLKNEVTNLNNQMATTRSENIDINLSMVELKIDNDGQVKQISDLHSEVLNLTDRLDQFRNEFVAANNKLQVQIQENEIIKNERDSLLHRNSQLIMDVYTLKLQVDNNKNAYELLGTLRKKYDDLLLSSGAIHARWNNQVDLSHGKIKIKIFQKNLKRKRKLLKMRNGLKCSSSGNLKIKLVKSKFTWRCVKLN